LALTLAIGTALGQVQDNDQEKCGNAISKDAAKVAATQGKINAACVKDGSKGPIAAACPNTDPKGKLGKALNKTLADETNACTAHVPDFGYTSGANANTVARINELHLLTDTYGTTDLSAVIVQGNPVGGCQAAVTKDLEKVAAAFQKDYVACKKEALKLGATGASAFAACVGGDTKTKIAGAITKLNLHIGSKCGSVGIATAFPGRCSTATAATLASCLGARAKCRMCQAINEADGIVANCDTVDDGLANGSCVSSCVLAVGSTINIYAAAYTVPLTFPMSGSSVSIAGLGGVAACGVGNFNPINVSGIGTFCITPAGGCPTGSRYCGPGAPASGPALGVDVRSDGNVGACTSNTACAATCDTHCAGLGAGFVRLAADCTAHCSGNTPAACTADAQCAAANNGTCYGPNPVPPARQNICQCSCVNRATFGASDPGDLQCNMGARIKVEAAAPCNGTDVTADLGTICLPVSTQRAKSKIVDANFVAASTVPGTLPGPDSNDRTGVPLACSIVDGGSAPGMQAVSAASFFSASGALGDLAVGLKMTCQ
jgi:hypothetical protein